MNNVHLHPIMADRHNLARQLLQLAQLARAGKITNVIFAANGDDPTSFLTGVITSGPTDSLRILGLAACLTHEVSRLIEEQRT